MRDPRSTDPRELTEAERALAGSPLDVPSKVELDRMLPGILDKAATATMSDARRFGRRIGALFGMATAIAMVALIVVVNTSDRDELASRGGDDKAGFALFCVRHDGTTEVPLANASCARPAQLVVQLPSSLAAERAPGERALIEVSDSLAHLTHVEGEPGDDGVIAKSFDLAPAVSLGTMTVTVRFHGKTMSRLLEVK